MSSVDEPPRKIRTFIYGSCVSRDTFDYLPADRFELRNYVARQSLIGLGTASQMEVEPWLSNLSSNFQRRMLSGDLRGSLALEIEREASEVDLLLWDLVDERLGVRVLPDGSAITRSLESINSGLDEWLAKRSDFVPFGSRRHRGLWKKSLRQFARIMSDLNLTAKTILVNVPWASETVTETPVAASFGLEPVRANKLVAPYAKMARTKLSCSEVRVPPEEVRADASHRWGAAPFHYDDRTYRILAQQVMRLTRDTR